MSKFTATVKHEFLEMLPPTIYFFVILHVLALVRTLMTRGSGIEPTTSISIIVAALILGKSVLLANLLPFINRFPEKPLIWNAAWKTLIYAIVATIIHYLEHLYEFWKESSSLGEANSQLWAHINWPHFWAIEILLIVLIANYCVFAELARLIGNDRLRAIFLGPLPAQVTQAPST
ncbi:hypothetical protein [Dyella sp. C9]|uniref:hypothetical protein n=1 Tax=Dyella sp. C9 TaxID=2202154 RepID=UPI000DEFE0AD|nr:hypothetical protein [Dyella sp. C9]